MAGFLVSPTDGLKIFAPHTNNLKYSKKLKKLNFLIKM
jgi:hypothetical protein